MFFEPGSETTIVPAQPGWSVAWPWEDKGKKGVTLDPIIAWLLVHKCGEYESDRHEKPYHLNPYPITAEGIVDNIGEDSGLKDPTGQFHIINVRICEDQPTFLAEWKFKDSAK